MTSLTSFCEMTCQIVQKKLEEKQIEEEQAAKAQNRKLPHHFNAEPDLVESMLNHDSSIVSSSSKIYSLLDEFAGELTLLKSIPPGIDKTDCHPENEIRLSQRLLYDNSSPRPPEEFNSENSNAEIESFSPSPIPDKDIRIFLPFFTYLVTSPVLLSSGSEDKIFDPCITVNHFYSFQPGLSHRCGTFKKFNTHRSHLNESLIEIIPENLKTLAKGFYPPSLKFLSFNWESYGICSLCNSMNSCAYDPNPNSFDYPPDSYHPPHPTYETYSGNSCGNDSQFGYDCPPQFPLNYEPEPGYTQNYNSCPHDSSSFPQQYPCCDDCGELSTTITKLKEQMTSLTSFCEMTCRIVQKKLEEKQIEEEQAAKAQNRKLPVCYDDDDDDDEEEINYLKDNIISELPPCSAITPNEPIDSLSMRDEHLDTILATESDELIKSCVENLVPNPSESEAENGCDVPSCFTTFSNILFDDEYEFNSVDDQSLHNENFSEKIFSNPLFEEEIISIKKTSITLMLSLIL
nr:hypothetical protein [Tanacetum cinerariifolium]